MNKGSSFVAIWLFQATLAIIPSAHADTVTLDNADQSGLVGSTLTFSGIITNTTGSSQLLGMSSAFTDYGPSFACYTFTPLLTESSLTLGPGASSADIPLFEFTVRSFPGPFPSPAESLTAFLVQDIGGGTQVTVADIPFTVTVSGLVAVPEPSNLLLLAIGLMGLTAVMLQWRREKGFR